MRQVVVIGCLDSCCDRLFVQVWCMVDALVHGTSLVQVGAWLMHLFMVQVDLVGLKFIGTWFTTIYLISQ
jgi:hypothetical protein